MLYLVGGLCSTAWAVCPNAVEGYVCVCEDGTGDVTVCFDWSTSEPSNPEAGTDFVVDFGCSGCDTTPAVRFKAAHTDWLLFAKSGSGTSTNDLASLSSIRIDPTTGNGHYAITIENEEMPSEYGADNIGEIILQPASGYHSSIADGYNYGYLGETTVVAVGLAICSCSQSTVTPLVRRSSATPLESSRKSASRR